VNADQTYRTRLTEIRDLMRRLDGQLAIHARRQTARPADWGFPGDLAHIAERLREITPVHTDRRCEWKHPKTCGEYAVVCLPDGRLLCHDHAPEGDALPSECLDLESGRPYDSDD
jgi:hypothetical protein